MTDRLDEVIKKLENKAGKAKKTIEYLESKQ